MVKERKLQTGSSNLSARGSCDMSMSKTMPGSNKKLFQKSYTHKLICPDEYPPAVRSGTHDRHIEKSAIWRPADLYRRDFQTIHRASFLDPQKQKPPTEMAAEKSLAEIDGANRLREKQVTALEQLVLFTKEHYGTSAAMMKRVSQNIQLNVTPVRMRKK